MFDTIRLKTITHIDENKFTQFADVKVIRYIDHTSYEINEKEIKYIRYFTNTKTLLLQVSIPKFLKGNNIPMINQHDIDDFFIKLQQKIFQMFGVTIEREEWIVSRLDIFNNFKLDNVSDCIRQIAKLKMPRKKKSVWEDDETVLFKNKSSQIKFYDKEKESQDSRARGIMRMEMQVSHSEMKKISPKRKAVELLTKKFFQQQTEKILSQIQFIDIQHQEITLDWIQSLEKKIAKIEQYIGFTTIHNSLEAKATQDVYGYQTYRNRLALLNEIVPPSQLKPQYRLKIDYDNLA